MNFGHAFAVADQKEASFDFFLDAVKNAQGVVDVFEVPKVGNVNDDFFAILALGVEVVALDVGVKALVVDKIVNDLDLSLDAQKALGVAFETVGHRSDGIAAVEGHGGEVAVAHVSADGGHVGAVEGGDGFDGALAHLFG